MIKRMVAPRSSRARSAPAGWLRSGAVLTTTLALGGCNEADLTSVRLTLDARLHWRRRTKHLSGWLGTGAERGRHRLSFAAKRLESGEWLIIATNRTPRLALAAYRRRWAIECLFGDAKTRGLNLEDTRLTDLQKLDLLMGLVALAIAWAARAARDLLGTRWPRRKSHGYLGKSWFRTGFDRIRNLLRSNPMEAIDPWRRIATKPRKICRVV